MTVKRTTIWIFKALSILAALLILGVIAIAIWGGAKLISQF